MKRSKRKSKPVSSWHKPGWEKRAQKYAEDAESVKKKSQKPARRVRAVRAPAKLPKGVKRVYRYVTKSGRFTRKRKGAKRRVMYFSTARRRFVSKKDLLVLSSYQKAQAVIDSEENSFVKEAIKEKYRSLFEWMRDHDYIEGE